MDFKFISSDLSRKYLKEENYPEIAKDTVFELYNQVGDIALKQDTLQKGLVVRLLVLPNLYKEYYEILDFLKAVSFNIGIWISSKYLLELSKKRNLSRYKSTSQPRRSSNHF